MRTLFLSSLAPRANSSVICVSSANATAGLMLQMSIVLALPPSDSCVCMAAKLSADITRYVTCIFLPTRMWPGWDHEHNSLNAKNACTIVYSAKQHCC